MSKRAAQTIADASAKKLKPSAITSFFKKDAVVVSSTPRSVTTVPSTPFDKAAWIAKLNDKQRELLQLEIDTLHDSWLSVLHQELTQPYFIKLKEFLAKERKSSTAIFPPEKDVYSWSRHTPLDEVKVVIIGQDPYHNFGQAHGLCFSVQAPTPAPPSLKNMYKALKKDYPSFRIPKHGSLLGWADQGVLLLNTCLTVRAHQANSHQKQGWEQFTQKVLDVAAANREKGIVFMAWGRPAADRVKKLDTMKHLRLESVHPSPLSAARGFFDCGHFLKANDWLTKRYSIEGVIDWDCLADGEQGKKEGMVSAKDSGATRSTQPPSLQPQESFAVSREEEELMAAAEEGLHQNDPAVGQHVRAASTVDSVAKELDKDGENAATVLDAAAEGPSTTEDKSD